MLVGVVGPVVYMVWYRGGRSPRWGPPSRVAGDRRVGPLFAGVQFAITLWGYDLPRPVDWVPPLGDGAHGRPVRVDLLPGFVQGRLEASFGTAPAVGGATFYCALYN